MTRGVLACVLVVAVALAGGCQTAPEATPSPALAALSPTETRIALPPTPTPTALPPSPTPRLARSVDVGSLAPDRQGGWFSVALDALPEVQLKPQVTVTVRTEPVANRRGGRIAETLAARYAFLQFGDIRTDLIEQHASTIDALFIRSALMSFVDYLGGTVLDWDGRSSRIPLDVEGVVRLANELGIPVYLELNYSDYIPGPIGTGAEALVPADNVTRTIDYLKGIEAAGLRVAGVTFGDEIGDDAGYGESKPTLATSDMAGRFIEYAAGLKAAFPALSVYAFDSSVGAAEGELWQYFDLLTRIREAEIEDGQILLDGFLFRESYVYINRDGALMGSQRIVADTDSLYKPSPVYRYDSLGVTHSQADQDYLHTLLAKTEEIFGRELEIGLSEYLPAGPTQIDESDTSPYADIDFILHYADVMGIYATLGLDYVSTYLFANEVEQAKCYLDRQGNEGVDYPVYAQLAEHLQGELLQTDKLPADEAPRLRVYAARSSGRLFIVMLNRDLGEHQVVRIQLPGEMDLAMDLPPGSYTSLIVEGDQVTVSGIGG